MVQYTWISKCVNVNSKVYTLHLKFVLLCVRRRQNNDKTLISRCGISAPHNVTIILKANYMITYIDAIYMHMYIC